MDDDLNTTQSSLRPRRKRGSWALRVTLPGLIALFLLNGILCSAITWRILQSRSLAPSPTIPLETLVLATLYPAGTPTPSHTPTITLTPTDTLTPTATDEPPLPGSATSLPGNAMKVYFGHGLVALSLQDGGYNHIFAYQPVVGSDQPVLGLTRLTYGAWDDIHPALSPDGNRVAFVSNRSRYWDIYVMDLQRGTLVRLTDTFEYEGHPSWSPDGSWLAYEVYRDESLEIAIRSVDDLTQEPIILTGSPSAEYAPAWSPGGRQLAFVSDRSGNAEILIADLDQVSEDAFINVSQSQGEDAQPAWSPDGRYLAWSRQAEGGRRLMVWDSRAETATVVDVGAGDWPVWSVDGNALLALLRTPYETYLTGYTINPMGAALPPILLPGTVEGFSWQSASLALPLQEPLRQAAAATPGPLWETILKSAPALTPLPSGRQQLVTVEDITAPWSLLQDMVDESFVALRKEVALRTGWDFLSTLENAFVPLTSPLSPGFGQSWLYSGRGIAVNSLPMNAGWMVVVRETYNDQMYWRVYLRARFQDGSTGRPLVNRPWDFESRFTDPALYETGGQQVNELPSGYWVDFTDLASRYGWERMPALPTWRSAFPAARFTEFAMRDGRTWQEAMIEIYPPEALITPTLLVPPTHTPTLTPRWYRTPTPTATLTPRPTFTPVTPTQPATRTPTITPTAEVTVTPTSTAAGGEAP